MVLLVNLCDLSWWQILLSWLLPFILGWILSQLLKNEPKTTNVATNYSRPNILSATSAHKNEEEIRKLNVVNLELESRLVECSKKALSLERSLFEVEIRSAEEKHQFIQPIDNTRVVQVTPDIKLEQIKPLQEERTSYEPKLENRKELKPLELQSNFNEMGHEPILSIEPTTLYDLKIFERLSNSNLQIFEGLGPKMESFLKSQSINSWKDLSVQNAKSIKNKLEELDPKYRILVPDSWPIQARMACDLEWNELIAYQKILSAGKSKEGTPISDSKLEKILVKQGLLKKYDKDDLKAIEGIGPKIENILHDGGIWTWSQLALFDEKSLKAILEKAGDRFQLADPKTWPYQAKLANDGKWKELFDYQDTLKGGKLVN